ncbi:MAG: anthranilate phosphoribosyltransferase, partial [FCB group bacterium]|nr:anthranilate phosphoribosyltransferase [FCB group bacterium]
KHGNRSMSSKSGSGDVLIALGVDITLGPEQVARCVEDIGIGFMFAPDLHPAIAQVANATSSMGVRTVFDVLGPLNNPAGVKRQVLGVYDIRLTERMAKVLKMLGSEEALIVIGHDDMDEITTTTSTKLTHLTSGGEIHSVICSPSEFGIKTAKLSDLKGGSPKYNAEVIRRVLDGEKGPHRDIVLLNAAAGIQISRKATTLAEGLKLAAESVDSGAARDILAQLQEV